MKFVETKTQFIAYDEDLKYDDSVHIYEMPITDDLNFHYELPFPKYEMILVSKGELSWRSALFINYRGLELRTKYKLSEEFILKILNAAKKNENYPDEIRKICKLHFSEEWYKKNKSVLETPNIKADMLEKKCRKLEEEQRKPEEERMKLKEERSKLELENIQFKERLKQIEELAKE